MEVHDLKSSTDCCENKKHKLDHETSSCEAETSPDIKTKCETYDQASSCDFVTHENNLKPRSPVISTSRSLTVDDGICSEEICIETIRTSSFDDTNIADRRDLMKGVMSQHSSERVESKHCIPVKSVISSGIIQPLINKESSAVNEAVNETIPDKQPKTELCSSNSVHANFPASSNDSCQELSVKSDNSCLEVNKAVVKNSKDVSVTNQSRRFCEFDLNEDITESGVENPLQPVEVTIQSHVSHVVTPIATPAKHKVPTSFQITPTRFEGQLGWKGSASTSAFRLLVSNNSINHSEPSKSIQSFEGIDLNVTAAEEENLTVDLFPVKPYPLSLTFPSEESSVNVCSKRAERFGLNLNCLGESDLDLNNNPLLQHMYQITDTQLDYGPFTFANALHARQPDLNSVKPPYLADLNSKQGCTPNIYPHPSYEQFHRLTNLPPKPKHIPSQSHAYSYNNEPLMDPKNYPLPSSPYNPCVPPLYLSSQHSTYPTFALTRSRHMSEHTGRSNPVFDLNGMVNYMPMEGQFKQFQQTGSSTAIPTKRKEPDDGWDFNQLGHKHVNSLG